MPRTILSTMHSVKQVIEDFLREMELYESGGEGTTVNIDEIREVFTSFQRDVRRRMQVSARLPKREDAMAFARAYTQLTPGQTTTLEDYGGAPQQVEEHFAKVATEMLAKWDSTYRTAMDAAYEEVLKAEQKWQRSVEHYLRKWNVDVVMRRKVLNETVDIQIYKSETCEVPSARADDLIAQHAALVPYTKTKRFLQPTKKEYAVSLEAVERFCAEYWRLWVEQADLNAEEALVVPLRDNFEAMCSTIAETQRRRERGNALQDEEFDFTFAHILAEVLPQIAAFDVQDPGQVDDDEVEALADVRAKVLDAQERIKETAGYKAGALLDRQRRSSSPNLN